MEEEVLSPSPSNLRTSHFEQVVRAFPIRTNNINAPRKKGIKSLTRKPMNGQIHFVDRMHQLSCLSGHLSEILKCVFIHFLTTFFFFLISI